MKKFLIIFTMILGTLSTQRKTFAINIFGTATGEYLDRLEALLKFEQLENQIVKKNLEILSESKSAIQGVQNQLAKIKNRIRNTKSDMQELANRLKSKIQTKIDQLTAENAARSEILKQTEAREVVEGTTSWLTRKAIDATGYGEMLQGYLNNWYQGDIEKKVKDITALKAKINELEKEIASQMQKINRISVDKAYKNDFDMFKSEINDFKKQKQDLMLTISKIQTDLIQKYSGTAKKLADERIQLFKKIKCAGTSPSQIRECKQYLIKQIKAKQPKLQACKLLPAQPTLAEIEACRKAYKATK